MPKSLSAAKDVPVVVHPHQRELPWKPNYPYSNDGQGSSNQNDAWFLVIRMLLEWSGVCAFDGLRTADRGEDKEERRLPLTGPLGLKTPEGAVMVRHQFRD